MAFKTYQDIDLTKLLETCRNGLLDCTLIQQVRLVAVEVLCELSTLELLQMGVVELIDIQAKDLVLVLQKQKRGLESNATAAASQDDDSPAGNWVNHYAERCGRLT